MPVEFGRPAEVRTPVHERVSVPQRAPEHGPVEVKNGATAPHDSAPVHVPPEARHPLDLPPAKLKDMPAKELVSHLKPDNFESTKDHISSIDKPSQLSDLKTALSQAHDNQNTGVINSIVDFLKSTFSSSYREEKTATSENLDKAIAQIDKQLDSIKETAKEPASATSIATEHEPVSAEGKAQLERTTRELETTKAQIEELKTKLALAERRAEQAHDTPLISSSTKLKSEGIADRQITTDLAKRNTYLEGALKTAQTGNSSRDKTITQKDQQIAEQQHQIEQLMAEVKESKRQTAQNTKELAAARSSTDADAAEEIAQQNVELVTQKNKLSQRVADLQNQLSTQEKGFDAQVQQAVSHALTQLAEALSGTLSPEQLDIVGEQVAKTEAGAQNDE